jgi:hypothetical protein
MALWPVQPYRQRLAATRLLLFGLYTMCILYMHAAHGPNANAWPVSVCLGAGLCARPPRPPRPAPRPAPLIGCWLLFIGRFDCASWNSEATWPLAGRGGLGFGVCSLEFKEPLSHCQGAAPPAPAPSPQPPAPSWHLTWCLVGGPAGPLCVCCLVYYSYSLLWYICALFVLYAGGGGGRFFRGGPTDLVLRL